MACERCGGEGWRINGEESSGEGTPAANRLDTPPIAHHGQTLDAGTC